MVIFTFSVLDLILQVLSKKSIWRFDLPAVYRDVIFLVFIGIHCWNSCKNDAKVRGSRKGWQIVATVVDLLIIECFSGFGKCIFQQPRGWRNQSLSSAPRIVGPAGDSISSSGFLNMPPSHAWVYSQRLEVRGFSSCIF